MLGRRNLLVHPKIESVSLIRQCQCRHVFLHSWIEGYYEGREVGERRGPDLDELKHWGQ